MGNPAAYGLIVSINKHTATMERLIESLDRNSKTDLALAEKIERLAVALIAAQPAIAELILDATNASKLQ